MAQRRISGNRAKAKQPWRYLPAVEEIVQKLRELERLKIWCKRCLRSEDLDRVDMDEIRCCLLDTLEDAIAAEVKAEGEATAIGSGKAVHNGR